MPYREAIRELVGTFPGTFSGSPSGILSGVQEVSRNTLAHLLETGRVPGWGPWHMDPMGPHYGDLLPFWGIQLIIAIQILSSIIRFLGNPIPDGQATNLMIFLWFPYDFSFNDFPMISLWFSPSNASLSRTLCWDTRHISGVIGCRTGPPYFTHQG